MITALINLIIWILILGILLALFYWVIDAIPLPEPINRIAKVVVVVVAAIVVILLLLQLVGVVVPLDVPRLAAPS